MEKSKLLELSSKHFACVYKLVFPNGRIYVGKSKDIGKRVDVYKRKTDGKWAEGASTALYGAIRFCGIDAVDCEILFKISGVVSGADWEKDLDYALGIVEMRWIKELQSSNPDIGYNSTEGGEMFGIRNMEKIKEVEKQRIVYKDVIVERERERQTLGVPVVGYDINGNYLGEWASRVSFSQEVVGIKSTMPYGVWKNGYIMYEKTDNVLEKVESYAEFVERTHAAEIEARRVLEERVGKIKTYRETKLNRGVVLVGANGEEVARFDNIREASEMSSLAYSSLYICLKNGFGTVGGFRVFWVDEWDADNESCLKKSYEKKIESRHSNADVDVKRHKSSKYGRVFQYDRYFKEVGIHETISDAAENIGVTPSCIYAAAKKGGNAYAGGYHWRFEADRIVPKDENQSESSQETLSDVEF